MFGGHVYGEHAYGGAQFSATAVAGAVATGQVGTLVKLVLPAFIGLAATGAVGSPTTSIRTGGLVGVSAYAGVGLTLFGGQAPAIGVRATGAVGTLALSQSVRLQGNQAVGHVGVTAGVGPSIIGVVARGTAGYIDDIRIDIVFGLAGWSGFTRRDGDAYGYAFADLFPQGQAWPRQRSTTFMGAVYGLADYWGFVDSRAADLLEIEADPRTTHELLPDWERAWGLPDPCLTLPSTEEERRILLVEKITRLGAQSRDWFWRFSRRIVGTQIYIQEFSPFTCGISQVGDTRPGPEAGWEEGHYRWEIGQPEIRFYWRVRPLGKTLHWFRCGRDNCGEDPMCRILPDIALECILTRLKPAATDIVFDYSLSREE
jgi:uncharacterized protein YmfQ (DUF2313 family)